MTPRSRLQETGICDAETIAAIESFQSRAVLFASPDGRVDPGGQTIAKLKANAREANSKIPHFLFPFEQPPLENYRMGMRKFGAPRKNGRKHAGCDLYAPVSRPIFAMEDGIILQNPYPFYLGTNALEMQCDRGGIVIRYGEISHVVTGIAQGTRVRRGDILAYVGKLERLDLSMLHLEMYSGIATGALTRDRAPYFRRVDLLDPTEFLATAERHF